MRATTFYPFRWLCIVSPSSIAIMSTSPRPLQSILEAAAVCSDTVSLLEVVSSRRFAAAAFLRPEPMIHRL